LEHAAGKGAHIQCCGYLRIDCQTTHWTRAAGIHDPVGTPVRTLHYTDGCASINGLRILWINNQIHGNWLQGRANPIRAGGSRFEKSGGAGRVYDVCVLRIDGERDAFDQVSTKYGPTDAAVCALE